jgi:hypothetical protein
MRACLPQHHRPSTHRHHIHIHHHSHYPPSNNPGAHDEAGIRPRRGLHLRGCLSASLNLEETRGDLGFKLRGEGGHSLLIVLVEDPFDIAHFCAGLQRLFTNGSLPYLRVFFQVGRIGPRSIEFGRRTPHLDYQAALPLAQRPAKHTQRTRLLLPVLPVLVSTGAPFVAISTSIGSPFWYTSS